MLEITIRELHMKTGQWVRKAAHAEKIVVLDRGRPVAKLVPWAKADQGSSFRKRAMVKGFAELPKLKTDSAGFISQDRDRA